MASLLIGSRSPRGGRNAWCSGSAAPQNISVAPSPAANSMENHTGIEYSGSSSSSPRRKLPKRETKMTMRKMSEAEIPPTYNQVRLSMRVLATAA